jgi:tRNA(His) guanylyltransferase
VEGLSVAVTDRWQVYCFCLARFLTEASAQCSTVGSKNELLFLRGINFNEVPLWQRRGTGIT